MDKDQINKILSNKGKKASKKVRSELKSEIQELKPTLITSDLDSSIDTATPIQDLTRPQIDLHLGRDEFHSVELDQPLQDQSRHDFHQESDELDEKMLPVAPTARIESLLEEAQQYADQARSPQTKRAYRADWNDFIQWSNQHHFPFLPSSPQYIALYLTERSKTLKVSSLRRRLTAIRQAHKLAGHTLDTKHAAIQNVWGGIRRQLGTAQEGKAPLRVDDLKMITLTCPQSLKGIRDKALLLLGFTGAFRRSELIGLNRGDLEFVPEGLKVHVRRSKTDQEGMGMYKSISHGKHSSTCCVKAVQKWLQISQIQGGPIFRPLTKNGKLRSRRLTGHAVAVILKEALSSALRAQGWPEKQIKEHVTKFSGHSLRAGYVTSAAAEGAGEHAIMKQTGHKRVDTLRRYIREGDLFRNNPLSKMDL